MRSVHVYRDRRDAGRILAAHLQERLGPLPNSVVLALARGGVPVGEEIARALEAILDVLVVLRIGVPGHENVPIGAIADGCYDVFNAPVIAQFGITKEHVDTLAGHRVAELMRRETLYREKRPPVSIQGRTVVIVDDGLSCGYTMRAAIAAVRERGPRKVVVTAPVGAAEACEAIASEVDALICPLQVDPFGSLASWYMDFAPTSDEEVCECLRANHSRHAGVQSGLH